jgi:hypothetical protein
MPIAVEFAANEDSGCCGDAARSWNDGTNIYMIAVGCAGYICAGEKTFSSGLWCTRALPILDC